MTLIRDIIYSKTTRFHNEQINVEKTYFFHSWISLVFYTQFHPVSDLTAKEL